MAGTVVFALHGFLGRPEDWSPLFQAMRADCSELLGVAVPYMDIRGLTPDVPLDRWGENFCIWANKQYPKSKKILLGYSMGGRLALHAAASRPEMWDKVILLSTHFGLNSDSEKRLRRDEDQRWAYKFLNADFKTVMDEWNRLPVFFGSRSEPERTAEQFEVELLAKALSQWSVSKQKCFLEDKSWVRENALWIAGENDSKYVNFLKVIGDTLPKHKINIIADSGHRVHFDQTELLADVILKFVR